MDIVALLVFALALLVNSGTPGPSVAAMVSRVITNGWRDVLPFLGAMWIGEVIWLLAALAGMTALAQTFDSVFAALKWLGIGYLCWLAWKMWHASTDEESGALPTRKSVWSMFGAGMALTMGNPKIMVFYLALLPTFFDLQSAGADLWLVLALITITVLAVVDCIWMLLAHKARQALRTPRAKRVANRVGATAMGGAAAILASR